MSSSSSSSSVSQQKYDVFLSFRGEDTRNNFTDHLYAALKRKGVITFKDDRKLEPSEEIKPKLLQAIQESWCSVIVFSKTYAFSSWCLEELAAIVQQKNEREQKIFPIFYYVDPSDLGKQKGKVEEAFSKHEETYKENKDKTQKWRDALAEVAKITGWHLVNKPESEFIEGIVQKIYSVVPRESIRSIFSFKDFMPSKSSTLTFNQIIKALNTNGVNMIGLYGMPGVGKTTLAKEVVKHFKEQKLFDNVVMVIMSQTPNISKIQDRIAESLHLKFEASTEEGKAEELWKRLKNVNNILIIIDDVWNEFDLQTIGIPFGVEHKGCKILLTMRLENVCVKMNCQSKFQLNTLSEEEAWALFKVTADLKDISSTLNGVAKEVASECKGLPLAIVAVGKALKGESLDGWIVANKRFKDSRHSDNEDVCQGVYNSLRLSYDYLKADNIRSCFLLCSLFPEDHRIDIKLLMMFGIGQGLFSDMYFLNDIWREIVEAVKKLLDSGLLLRNDGYDDDVDEIYVRMHDVVCDFAHWIISKGENMLMVKEGLAEWPISERLECYTAICFWNSKIDNFPKNLEFSKLKILVFENQISSVRVPNTFVAGMKALRVLCLKNVIFSLEAIKFLRNLQVVRLLQCKLHNISSLRDIKNLKILELTPNIPKGPSALHRQKSLFCSSLRGVTKFPPIFYSSQRGVTKFPPSLLSRLTSLQQLHVEYKMNVNFSELNSLFHLTRLSLSFSVGALFSENFVFPKLQRYNISVNADLLYSSSLNFRYLKIYHFCSLRAFEKLFCNVEKLSLCNVFGIKYVVPSVDREGQKMGELEGSQILPLSNLKMLNLDDLPQLESIWKLEPFYQHHLSLRSLKVVKISRCMKLKSIFPTCIAQSLLHLQQLDINNCSELKHAFDFPQKVGELEENQILPLSNLTSLKMSFLPQLESIWKLQPFYQYHLSLRSLKVVAIRECMKLKSIFPTCIAQSLLHLQQLDISDCSELEHVFDFPQNVGGLEESQILPLSNLTSLKMSSLPELESIWKLLPIHQCHLSLQSLEDVTIEKCMKLKSIFSTCVVQSLLHLQKLDITHCSGVEHVFDFPQKVSELQESQILPLSNLTSLKLGFLPELESIWKLQPTHQCYVSLQSLKDVTIEKCMKLKSIFSTCVAQSLLHLQQLNVSYCSGLEHVFDFPQKVGEFQESLILPLSNLTSLKLSFLPELESIWKLQPAYQYEVSIRSLKDVLVAGCHKLKSIFLACVAQSLLHLQRLEISCCDGLEQVFEFPQKLGELELHHVFETEELLHDMEENKAPSLSNLASLELKSLPELKWIWKGPCHYVCLQSLKVAKIISCNRLKYLFLPSLAQSLVLLEELFMVECEGLEHIITTDDGHLHPPLLAKLTCLEIDRCPSLEYVFKIDLDQGLPYLKSLWIVDASQLKQVFINAAKQKKAVDHAFALPRLQHMLLQNLTKLRCFCSENYPILSPSLENLTVKDCPRLENFAIQQVNKEVQLKELQLSQLKDVVYDAINCEVIKLVSIHQLRGPFQSVASLQYLRELTVSNCSRLRSLFSSVHAPNLPQLKLLSIKCCEGLEEIIEMDQTSIASSSSQGHLQPISFPVVEDIWIYRCGNLKSLFSISVVRSVSNIKRLKIEGVSNLEQIFGDHSELDVEDDQKEIVFPKLKEFKLLGLPKLKNFAPRAHSFRFPSFRHLEVTKCPKFITSFSMARKNPVNAITEAHQQGQNNTMDGFTTMKEIVDNQYSFNDIIWTHSKDPIDMTMGETKIRVGR